MVTRGSADTSTVETDCHTQAKGGGDAAGAEEADRPPCRRLQENPLELSWNDIFDHHDRIGAALWEFLWCLDRITEESDGVGLVLGGKPIKLSEIVSGIKGSNRETVRRNVEHLEREAYIRRRRTPYGYVVEVPNSDLWKEKPQNDVSQPKQKPQIEVSEPKEKPQNEVSLPREKHGFATSVPDFPSEPSLEVPQESKPLVPPKYLAGELNIAARQVMTYIGFSCDREHLSRGFVKIVEKQARLRPWRRPGMLASKILTRCLYWQTKLRGDGKDPRLYAWPPGFQKYVATLRTAERLAGKAERRRQAAA